MRKSKPKSLSKRKSLTRTDGSKQVPRLHLYDAVDRVLVYDAETIEIVWKFDDIALDNDVHA